MIVVCIREFGAHAVGDEVELPDDADFAPMYFSEKPTGKGAKTTKQPAQVAKAKAARVDASDEAQGTNTDESLAPVVTADGPKADDDDAANDDKSNSEDK